MLRSDVHLSSIFVRDNLLDVARERAPEYREQLAEFRRTSVATFEELGPLVGRDDQISSLQAKLAEYWETFDRLFDWTPTEKISRSATFPRREVVPRREAIPSIAQGIEELNNENLAAQSAEVASRHTALCNDLRRLTWQTVSLGLAVRRAVSMMSWRKTVVVGIGVLTWGTTPFASTHEIHRGQLKSQRDATEVPSAAVPLDIDRTGKYLLSGLRRFGSTLLHRGRRRIPPS